MTMLPRFLIVGFLIGIFGQLNLAQEPTPLPYSDSIPYKPRLFRTAPDKKSRDKSAKDTTPAPTATPVPEVMPGNGPTVKEGSPITIPVSVFDAQGKFVTGLKKEDFKILIDGPEAQVLSVEQRTEPLNVLLVLDTSASSAEVLESIKEVATKLVGEFPAGDRISVMEFNEQLKEVTPLSTDRDAAIKAVSKLRLGSGTAIYDITRKIFGDIIPTLTGRTVVLLLTDGVDTTSLKTKYSEALVAAERSGASVFPIYLDTFVSDPRRVRGANIASLPWDVQQVLNNARFSRPDNYEDEYALGKLYLNDLVFLSGGRASDAKTFLQNKSPIAGTIADELHQQYYLTFSPVGSAYIGQRKHLKVRVDHPNLTVIARGSYVVGSPPSNVGSK